MGAVNLPSHIDRLIEQLVTGTSGHWKYYRSHMWRSAAVRVVGKRQLMNWGRRAESILGNREVASKRSEEVDELGYRGIAATGRYWAR